MKGFDKKYKNFPDYILKITKQIWEGKDVDSIGEFYTKDIPVRSPFGITYGNKPVIEATYNTLIDLSKNNIPKDKTLLNPISSEEIKQFDNYNLSEIEKFISKFPDRINHEIKLNENFKITQILGNQFQNKNFSSIINQNTGFNLSILKSKKGKISNLKFSKPTVMFSQIGLWKIQIDDFEVNLNPKDTISIPINSNINVSIDNEHESLLNCVTQI